MKKIKLTKGKYALVSDEDFNILSLASWCASQSHRTYRKGKANKFYALRRVREGKKTRAVYMHRAVAAQIFGETAIKGLVIDHIDGNSLNNQRENLRPITERENSKPFYRLNRVRRKKAKAKLRSS